MQKILAVIGGGAVIAAMTWAGSKALAMIYVAGARDATAATEVEHASKEKLDTMLIQEYHDEVTASVFLVNRGLTPETVAKKGQTTIEVCVPNLPVVQPTFGGVGMPCSGNSRKVTFPVTYNANGEATIGLPPSKLVEDYL